MQDPLQRAQRDLQRFERQTPKFSIWFNLQVYHELVVLERLHKAPNFSPAVMLEAITRPLLLYA